MDNVLNLNTIQLASTSIIKVLGVGGAGCNAVKHMYEEGIHNVEFIICNTDAQALEANPIKTKVPLGAKLTEGRGAGNYPEQGRQAAVENIEDVRAAIGEHTKMLFITAGMGGGTGTGAAPIIAELAKSMGILTIAVVSIPSPKEGRKRYEQAKEGVDNMRDYVDSMLVISNDKLHSNYGSLPASQAFKQADSVITAAVKGVAEIITVHGNINIDFADVHTVLEESKVFIMGTGFSEGEGRAIKAVQEALESPLLDSSDIRGSEDILLHIISGNSEVTIDEVGEILDFLQDKAGDDANIIWGNGIDPKLGDRISVTVVATRFEINPSKILQEKDIQREVVNFQDNRTSLNPDEHERIFNIEYNEYRTATPEKPKVPKLSGIDQSKEARQKQKTVKPKKEGPSWLQRTFNSFLDEGNDAEVTND